MSFAKNDIAEKNFSQLPLLCLSIFYAAGIFSASYLGGDWKFHLAASLLCAILSAVFIASKRAFFLLSLAFFFAGGFSFQIQKQFEPANSIKSLIDSGQIISGDPIEIEGTLEAKPESAVEGYFLFLKAETLIYKGETKSSSGRVRLFLPVRERAIQAEYESLRLEGGAKIRVACNLVREEKYLNPGGISYKKILDQKDIDAAATVKSPLLIERLKGKNGPDLFGVVRDQRQKLIEGIHGKFSVGAAGILIASLLGNRNFLTKDTADIFREGGTFHVLVISGLHITFIGGLLLFIVRRFTRKRLPQFLITAFILWVYAFAVGAEIPVVRAALMFTILLFAFVIFRRSSLINALGTCALAILIWRPQDLFSQSFHLTFASLFGIIAIAFPLIEKLRAIGSWQPSSENPFPPRTPKPIRSFCEAIYWSEKLWSKTLSENVWNCRIFKTELAAKLENSGFQKPLRWIFEGMLVTAVVQIFLLPFLAVYFHRLSFSSVILNLWVGIFIVLQNGAALIALLFAQFSSLLSFPFAKITEFFNWAMVLFPNLFIRANLASIRVPVYSGWLASLYPLYFVPLIFLIVAIRKWDPFSLIMTKRRLKVFVKTALLLFAFLFLMIVFHPFSAPKPSGKLTFDFLDVGQGDSIFITFPNGKTMIIDGGGRHNFRDIKVQNEYAAEEDFDPDVSEIGETVVSEFLWAKGYSKIDYAVATHSDADHIQGLTNVIRNFKVRAVFIGKEPDENVGFEDLKKAAARKSLNLTKLERGDLFEIGGVEIEVLNPNSNSETSSNNDSLVFRMSFGGRKFLLTGDIEKEAESELITAPAFLKADVVKVAHHGSRTSSTKEFVEAANADYAIIPVGKKSRFGHPHEEVVRRWKKAGAKVLTTGEKGTITISTDGKNLEIQTFIK